MNTNFGAWTNEKEEGNSDPSEEQIDPTFARQQDPDFPTVEDVTAAAVANALHLPHQQHVSQQQHGGHSQGALQQTQQHRSHQHTPIMHHGRHSRQDTQNPHQSDEDQVSAAQAAAELQQVQQVQQQQQAQQQQHFAAVAAAANLQDGNEHDSSDNKMKVSNARPVKPVSSTKRAAQNRSAQKAFRQRKDKYIKDLEQQAAEVNTLKQTIEELRAENLQLRDYTLALQSRVIELSPTNSHHQIPPTTHHTAHQQDPSNVNVNAQAPPAVFFNGNKMFNNDK